MGIRTSTKADETTVKDFKYFTGVIPYNVVAVNPTLAELKELGVEYLQKEPEYITEMDFDGNIVKNTNIDFWVQSVPDSDIPELDILTQIRFRINHKDWVGQSGKTQFINRYGRTAWADSVEMLDSNPYFINEGTRPSHRGEEDLHKFIFAWLNMVYDTKSKQYDDCLVNIDKIVKGDLSELKAIVIGSKEYKVKIVTGINVVEKDGKIKYYYTLYNQMFLKHNQTSTNRLEEYITRDEYTKFKASGDLHFTYDIQEFDKSAKPDEDVDSSTANPTDIF